MTLALQVAHLHVHDMFSHDGVSTPSELAEYVATLGQKHLAITNHGNMSGVALQEQECLKAGIHPVFGCEIYYQPMFLKHPSMEKDGVMIEDTKTKAARYHMTVLCESQKGYVNLCEMMAHASSEQFFYVPIVTWKDLERWHEGLIVLSGCISSYLAQAILAGAEEVVHAHMEEMVRLFGENFYLEVQPFGDEAQKRVNTRSMELAQQYNVRVVMTADAHYRSESDYCTDKFFQIGYFMRKKTREGDIRVDYSDRYLHSAVSMHDAWATMMDGHDGTDFLQESVRIAERCNVRIKQPIQMPDMGQGAAEKLYRMIESGLLHRLQEVGRASTSIPSTYRHRLDYEWEIIIGKGFVDYILLAAQVAAFARMKHIFISARGSACGSLLCYALGISLIDPLVYGTSFDRFLSWVREDLPDIDLDINARRKKEVVEYMYRRFPGHAMQIANYGTWKGYSLADALATYFEMSPIDKETLRGVHTTCRIPTEGFTYEDLMASEVGYLETEYPGSLRAYAYFYGKLSFISEHAAGVAVTRDMVTAMMPVMRSRNALVTALDKVGVEYAGAVKIDLLSVEALSALDDAFQYAGIEYAEDMVDEPTIYQELAKGETVGIFQLGSRQARDILKKIKPTCLADIAAVNALNRPVPIREGSLDIYLSGKQKSVALAQFCTDTRGALLYQEQVMALCHEYAGMSWGEVDKVLKMLKKYQEDNLELRTVFVKGCMKQQMPETEANALWEHIRRYLFNKSHAVAYSFIAVVQAWLRKYHPIAWYYSLLKHEQCAAKRLTYEADAIRRGVAILPVTVNAAQEYAIVSVDEAGKQKAIQRGLLSVKGISDATADAIVREKELHGEYTTIENFKARLPKRIASSSRVEVLQREGCFIFDEEGWDEAIQKMYAQLWRVFPYE